MKNLAKIAGTFLPICAFAFSSGCSTLGGGGKSGEEIAGTGPTVVEARANPETVELDVNLKPQRPPEVIAEVKDFTSPITEVTLRFANVPIEIPLQHVGGTTWRGTLSPEQIETLAVGGQTVRYEANIVATNEQGETAVSRDPVTVAVKTPELAGSTG